MPTFSQPVQLNFITVAFHQFAVSLYVTYGTLLLSIAILIPSALPEENHIGPTASQPVQLNFITVAFHKLL